jgi:zinc transport system substrate-binding protein
MEKVKSGVWKYILLLMFLLIFLILMGKGNIVSHLAQPRRQLNVFVSILPQKYFVERISGDKVKVSVMVGPGQNPATYEPLPKQMVALTEADLYFQIGVPFETVWIKKIQSLNPQLKIVDTREGITLRKMEGAHSHNELEPENKHEDNKLSENKEVKDPHIWLDPLLVKIQVETICRELSAADPENKAFYEQNLREFQGDLDQLHGELTETFESLPVKKLMVFHPSWGYLTDRYGLKQIPIEIEGKEPGPRELAKVIDQAKQEGIRVIFVQTQFDTKAAESVARAVEGKVIPLDPLAEDYMNNLRRIAAVIKKEL